MKDPYGLVVGLLFVLVYAYDRFNTPPTNRSSTTRLRYWTACMLYLAASVLVFLFLAELLDLSPKSVSLVLPEQAVKMLEQLVDQSAGKGNGFSYYLLSALCLTILLTKAPGLRQIDDFIRLCFQRFGAIPYQVHRLSLDLANATFTVPADQKAKTAAGLNGGDIKLDAAEGIDLAELNGAWLRLRSLVSSLETLRGDSHYFRFFQDFDDSYQDLTARAADVDRRALAFIRLQLEAPLQLTGSMHDLLESYRVSIQSDLASILEKAHLLIARAILICERTKGARFARVKRLGLVLTDSAAVRINYDRLALLLVGLTSLVVAVSLASIYLQETQPQYVLNLRHALKIAIVVWAAVLWAILIKKTSRWAQPGREGSRPYIAYLVAGALAVLTQIVVYAVIKVMIVDDPRTVLEYLPRTIPWSPLVFFMAFLTSLQCDDQGRSGVRWQEAVFQSIVIGATAWTAYRIIEINPAWGPEGFAGDEVWTYVAGGAILGFGIGALVPNWYRIDNQGNPALRGRDAASERSTEWQPA